jgi:hypothetical protein
VAEATPEPQVVLVAILLLRMAVLGKVPEVAVAAKILEAPRARPTAAAPLNPEVSGLLAREVVAGTPAVAAGVAVGMAAAVVEGTTTPAAPMVAVVVADLLLQTLRWLRTSVIKLGFRMGRVK